MADILAALLILIGSFFFLVAALGLVRLPDAFMRLHAVSIGSTFAVMPMILAVPVSALTMANAMHALIAIVFLMLTTPVSGHLLARAAYVSGIQPRLGPVGDEAQIWFRRVSPLAQTFARHRANPVEELDPPDLEPPEPDPEPEDHDGPTAAPSA